MAVLRSGVQYRFADDTNHDSIDDSSVIGTGQKHLLPVRGNTAVLLSNPLKWIALGSDCEYLLRPTALARRCRPGSLQASSDSSPVSERPRTTISVGALHPGLQC